MPRCMRRRKVVHLRWAGPDAMLLLIAPSLYVCFTFERGSAMLFTTRTLCLANHVTN